MSIEIRELSIKTELVVNKEENDGRAGELENKIMSRVLLYCQNIKNDIIDKMQGR
jgi:hypothetical protein